MPVMERKARRSPAAVRKPIPIFGLGKLQRSPFVSTVERINAVVELTENGRQQAAIFNLPGLIAVFNTLNNIPFRAFYIREGEDIAYGVQGEQFISMTLQGGITLIATLNTDEGPAWISDNGDELFVNDGSSPGVFNTATNTYTPITDPDYPSGALGGTFHNGRFFVFTPTPNVIDPSIQGRVYGSDPFAGLNWDGLNFFTPESVPDGISEVYRWKNDLIVFGQTSIEFWGNVSALVPGALGYAPIGGGVATEVGLAATLAYAPAGQQLFFLGRMRGQASVFEMVGYSPQPVSPPKLDEEWASLLSRVSARACGYVVAGHPIFQLTFPLATEGGQTWAYDTSTKLWCERRSFDKPYYRGLITATSKDRVYITSAFDGKVFLMAHRIFTEDGEAMIFQVTSIHLLKEGDHIAADEVWIDMETGLGTTQGQGQDPQAMIQISKDGGHVWGQERFVTIGKTGQYTARAVRRRIGSARDIAIRLRITDPVPRRICGAYLKLSAGVS